MTTPRMASPRTAVNRTVLTVTGLVLLLGGAWLAGGTGPVARRLPAWWPAPPDAPLLDRAALAGLRANGWWTPTVVAAGVLATALLAWWLLAQLHVRRRPRLALAVGGGSLRTRALEEAFTERASAVEGVGHCRTRLRVRRRRLHLRLHVRLDPAVTPDTVIEPLIALTTELESAAAPYEIDTHLRMSHLSHRTPHVR